MSTMSTWERYMVALRGLCIFMFYATLLFMELAFVGHTDPENTTASFRAALPVTVFVPFIAGVLIGHWFHPGKYGPDLITWLEWVNFGKWTGFIITLVTGGVLIGLGLVFYFVQDINFVFPAWSMVLTGVVLGIVFWPVYKYSDLKPDWVRTHSPDGEPSQQPNASLLNGFHIAFASGWVAMIVILIISGARNFIAWAFVGVSAFWMAFIIVTDVFLAGGSEGDTWSEQIRKWSKNWTTAPPWIFGVLTGRWFHPLPQLQGSRRWGGHHIGNRVYSGDYRRWCRVQVYDQRYEVDATMAGRHFGTDCRYGVHSSPVSNHLKRYVFMPINHKKKLKPAPFSSFCYNNEEGAIEIIVSNKWWIR